MIKFTKCNVYGSAFGHKDKDSTFAVNASILGTGSDRVAKIKTLLAAAPDLLEACEQARLGLLMVYDASEDNENNPVMGSIGNKIVQCQVAIAKAEGK